MHGGIGCLDHRVRIWCVSPSDRPNPATPNECAPTGKLRFGVVTSAERTSFFVVRDADGKLRGVTAGLGHALARHAGTPIGIVIAVPKSQPNALAYVTAFLEDAKASGIVRRAFDDASLKELSVAPASGGR